MNDVTQGTVMSCNGLDSSGPRPELSLSLSLSLGLELGSLAGGMDHLTIGWERLIMARGETVWPPQYVAFAFAFCRSETIA